MIALFELTINMAQNPPLIPCVILLLVWVDSIQEAAVGQFVESKEDSSSHEGVLDPLQIKCKYIYTSV